MSESLANWDSYLQVASKSDIGMRRTTNQDNLCISPASNIEHWQKRGHLFVVADGMGAHAAGEFASKLAIDHIPHLYAQYGTLPVTEALRKSVEGANVEIHRRGQANEEFHNMGTTCSVLTLLPQGALIAHVGDSRVYRLRKSQFEQLTFDHSLYWEMRASGQIQSEEQRAKIPKNIITRSLGPIPEVKVDLEGPFPVEQGDTFLLCSDGLTGQISDAEIGSILAHLDPKEAAQVLVDLANLRGGADNITLVIVKVLHPELVTTSTQFESKKTQKSISPIPIVVFGVMLVLTLLLAFLATNWLFALIAGALTIGSLVWLLASLFQNWGQEQPETQGQLGKGPYTRTDCGSGERVVKQLSSITTQLQQGAEEQKWPVDFAAMNKMIGKAQKASDEKNSPVAIKTYARTITWLMDQLRNNSSGSSSSIDL